MRKEQAARLAGVPVSQVQEVDAETVRYVLSPIVPVQVVEVATQEPATYWRVVGPAEGRPRIYLDDPLFGPVVAIDDLVYDRNLGLTVRPGAPTAD